MRKLSDTAMTFYLANVHLILIILNVPAGNGGCRLPSDWLGSWHHLGYNDPLNITVSAIDMKGTCHEQLDWQETVKTNAFGQFILQEDK